MKGPSPEKYIKTSLVHQCLEILKREDIKYEFRSLVTPIMNIILYELNPYIYIIIGLVLSLFIMILAILVLLIFILRNKNLVVTKII